MCYCLSFHIFFFFFSSRRRHTRFDCDWSSDVCSSDLVDSHAQRSDRSSASGARGRALHGCRSARAERHHDGAGPLGRRGAAAVQLRAARDFRAPRGHARRGGPVRRAGVSGRGPHAGDRHPPRTWRRAAAAGAASSGARNVARCPRRANRPWRLVRCRQASAPHAVRGEHLRPVGVRRGDRAARGGGPGGVPHSRPSGHAGRSDGRAEVRMMDTLLADLRYAARTLRKSPGFAAAAILTLALAIGSNTAVFSVVNGVLLRPLPFAEQDRLFMLAEQSRQGAFRPPSYPTFLDWRAHTPGRLRAAGVPGGGQRLAGPEGVQSIPASFVSPGFFATLGEPPLVGRLFTQDEEQSGAHVTVLSYDLWQARFGGDPAILGKTLSLTAGVFTVVGVLPHRS